MIYAVRESRSVPGMAANRPRIAAVRGEARIKSFERPK